MLMDLRGAQNIDVFEETLREQFGMLGHAERYCAVYKHEGPRQQSGARTLYQSH